MLSMANEHVYRGKKFCFVYRNTEYHEAREI